MKKTHGFSPVAAALLLACGLAAVAPVAPRAAEPPCRVRVDAAQVGKDFFDPSRVVQHEDTTIDLRDTGALGVRFRIINEGPAADLRLLVDGVGLQPIASIDVSPGAVDTAVVPGAVRAAAAGCVQGETTLRLRVVPRTGPPEDECGAVTKHFACVDAP